MGHGLDDAALQARIRVAGLLGLNTAVPARSCFVTRVDRRIYVGLRDAGFVRLRAVDARALAAALVEMADDIDAEHGP